MEVVDVAVEIGGVPAVDRHGHGHVPGGVLRRLDELRRDVADQQRLVILVEEVVASSALPHGIPQYVAEVLGSVLGDQQVRHEERHDVGALRGRLLGAVEHLLQRVPRGELVLQLHEAQPDLQRHAVKGLEGDHGAHGQVVVGPDLQLRVPARQPRRGRARPPNAHAVQPAQLHVEPRGPVLLRRRLLLDQTLDHLPADLPVEVRLERLAQQPRGGQAADPVQAHGVREAHAAAQATGENVVQRLALVGGQGQIHVRR
mmetsp:Transcript_63678/g.197174  ORF Transcript_63678/g.197174 Transcript_63678/m.197174 type:complete len:258 (-) Transcript_63678:120-893(-)